VSQKIQDFMSEIPDDIDGKADYAFVDLETGIAVFVQEGPNAQFDDILRALGNAVNHYIQKRDNPQL